MPYAKMPVVFQAFLFYFVILIPRFIIGRPLMRQEGVYYSESQIRHRYVNDRSRTINCGDSYLNILTAVEVCDNKRTRKTFTVMTHCKRASKCRPPLTCTSPNRALFIKYTCRSKTPLNIEDDGEYRVTASNMMIAKMRCGIDRYLDIISAVYGYGFYESGEVVPMNIVNDVRRLCQKKEACSFVQDFRHNKEFKGKDNFALIEFQCKKDTETCYSVVCPVHSHCVEGKKGPQCICDPGCVLENGVCVDKTIYLDESFKNLSLEHSTIWIPDQVDEITDNVDKLVDNTGSDADVRGVETDKETGTVVLNTDDSDFTTSFDLIENDEEYLDSENSDANEISNPPSVEELGIHQGIDHREYMEDITDKNNMNNNTNVLDDEMLHNDQHEKENGFIMVDQKDKTEISMGTKLDEDGSGEMNENINHDNRNLHNEVEKRDNDVNDTNDNSRIEHKKIDVKENSQDNQKESSSSNAIVNDNQLNSPTDIDAKIGELVDFNSSIVRGNNVGTEETNATGSMDTIINSRLNTNDESHASYTAVSQGKPTNDTYEDHTSVGTPDNGHSNISDDKKISITVPLVENNCAIEAESPDKNLKANYKPPKLDYRYRDNRPNDHSIISDKIGKIFNENENKKSLFSHVDAMENTIMPNITQNGERLSNVIKLGNKGSNNTEETSSPFKCFIPIGQMSVKEKGQQAYVEFEGRHDKDHGHIYRYRHCTANNE